MNRRELLQRSALVGTSLAVPGLSAFTNRTPQAKYQYNHIKINVADLEVLLFSDGHISLNNPQPIFAPQINPLIVREELKKIFLKEDQLDCAINIMLIKKDGRIILIDTGSGYHLGETGGWLSKNLEEAGIKPSDVTDILITHAHIDHIGGIIKEDKTFLYPNAQYYMTIKEYDFWMAENPDFSKSKNPQSPKQNIEWAKSILNSIEKKLILFNHEDLLFSCIKTELAEGHTPGHTVFTVFSGDKSIKHIVDTAHTPLLITKPEWGTQWDVDFNKGVHTRKKILEHSFLNRTLVMTTHLPWPGLGYIGKNDNHYQWHPLSYFTPNEIVL